MKILDVVIVVLAIVIVLLVSIPKEQSIAPPYEKSTQVFPYIGDCDGNGIRNQGDVTYLTSYIRNEELPLYEDADFNCDGEIDSKDISRLESYMNNEIRNLYECMHET